jgi:hypothetical protein
LGEPKSLRNSSSIILGSSALPKVDISGSVYCFIAELPTC